MSDDNFQVEVIYKTHCPKCGSRLTCKTIPYQHDKKELALFSKKVKDSFKKELANCKTCKSKIPVIPEEWAMIFESICGEYDE